MSYTEISALNAVSVPPASFADCEDLAADRVVVVEAGSSAVLKWPLIDPTTGEETLPTRADSVPPGDDPYDFTDADHKALFLDPFDQCLGTQPGRLMYISGQPLLIELPAVFTNRAAIYWFEVRWKQLNGVVCRPRGLVSVEPSLFQSLSSSSPGYSGMLTVSEIRTELRDSPIANDVIQRVEYSGQEILRAIAAPISYWNETPPVLTRYSTSNFPHRQLWLSATVGRLRMITSEWMLRNDVAVQGTGITSSERGQAKWQELYRRGKQDWDEFKSRVGALKHVENVRSAFRIM